jgi:outer membrane protein assembly factor BamB
MRSMKSQRLLISIVCVWLTAVSARLATAEDWPAWRGPNRDGVCQETGLLKQWPSGGPKLAWKAKGLGEGYSGPSIVGNLLFTMGDRDGKEWVLALDWTKEGQEVWATPIGPIRHQGEGFPGPRATPTYDDGRLYTLGINGDLICLDAKTGKEFWRRDLVNDFGGRIPQWGYSESVLVDGPWVVFTPGGAKATIAAVNKTDGKTAWQAPVGDPAAYSSVIKATIGKVDQYVTLTAKGMIGVRAKDGEPLWRYDRPASKVANVATCIWYRQTVFASSGYNTGGGLAWIKKTGKGFTAQELYFTKDMKNHHGGVLLVDGYLYGANEPGILTCLDFKTGKVKWTDRSSGKCSLLFADGMLYARSEKGPVSLVAATSSGFELKGRFNQPDLSGKKTWPHPVIANGLLFLRDQDVLLCYDVRDGK